MGITNHPFETLFIMNIQIYRLTPLVSCSITEGKVVPNLTTISSTIFFVWHTIKQTVILGGGKTVCENSANTNTETEENTNNYNNNNV